ncbi:unnamed protein product [Adineta ricciae]|uniref:G-protein coupled receptors family 1 profile domain-containing protein n=1 Tax=Adineta ricciae TaxID=249248 RepID=A0A813UKR0_ADIRI|nr:unnamed protein product [Adineta ricciae]CAF1466895.1 unnamed protein product [Adineta ricciae]
MVMHSLCPCALMFLFGMLTLKNVRRHRLVMPVITEANRAAQRTDAQILCMLTAQVFVTILFTLLTVHNDLYASFTRNWVRNTYEVAQLNLLGRVTGTIPYFAHSSTFYLYTLTDTIFRRELVKIFRRWLHQSQNIFITTQNTEAH